jgi:hypothetical protein
LKLGDNTLTEEDTTTNPSTPSADLDFQNLIALLIIELRSQTCTTSTRRDLYYTAVEIAAGVPEIEEEDETEDGTEDETGYETGDHFSTDSDGDFDPESDEDAQDMNMKH